MPTRRIITVNLPGETAPSPAPAPDSVDLRHDWASNIKAGDYLAFPYMHSGPLPYPHLGFDRVASVETAGRDLLHVVGDTGRRQALHPSQIVRIITAPAAPTA